ncbi:MAG: hypothetical protein AVDCRST_MAG36-3030, partial [uncultured Nocardioidaceae bacterium]
DLGLRGRRRRGGRRGGGGRDRPRRGARPGLGRPPRRPGAGRRTADGAGPAGGAVHDGVPRLPDLGGRRAHRPAGHRDAGPVAGGAAARAGRRRRPGARCGARPGVPRGPGAV